MAEWSDQLTTVFYREIRTLRRTRSVWAFAIGFFVVTLGAGFADGASGYVSLSLSLMTPLQVFTPLLVALLGYRAILADRERGEVDILRTYPTAPETFLGGVYLGRLAAVLCIVLGSLLTTGLLVPLLRSAPAFSQETAELGSPLQYFEFVVFTAVFAAVILAVMLLVSTIVRNARQGLVVTVVVVSAIAIGFDLGIVFGVVADLVAPASLPWYLALSPVSAYRGLVMTVVVAPVLSRTVDIAVPVLSSASLFLWFLLSMTIASGYVWSSAES